ncbi:MAG: hypothetical protein ACPL1Z_05320 [Candidatus Bathyarchaeales archaeon]
MSWSLGVGYEGLSIGASITAPPIHAISTNYTKFPTTYNGESYMFLSSLHVTYSSNPLWGSTYAEGAGSIGIPNDLAKFHSGHHIQILIVFVLFWTCFFPLYL